MRKTEGNRSRSAQRQTPQTGLRQADENRTFLQPGTVTWTEWSDGEWHLRLAASSRGLCYVEIGQPSPGRMLEWLSRHFPNRRLLRNDEAQREAALQFRDYLAGDRYTLTLPLDIQGSAFRQQVWKALSALPYGQTISYSSLARQLNKPDAVRAVAAAVAANPLLLAIPCHRVVGANGALTGYRDGLAIKARLLRLESRGQAPPEQAPAVAPAASSPSRDRQAPPLR